MTEPTPATILVRARVEHHSDNVYTVRLEDGLGQAKTVVHQDSALPDPQPTSA